MGRRWLDRLPGKRVFLARTLEATGGARVLERSAFRRQGPGRALVVFTYHRIAVPRIPANPYYDPVISATPDGFRDQVRALARRYRLVGLEDLLEENRSRSDDRPAALITFDDGYRDNYTNALPILRELGAKAVFFIPSGLIDASSLAWWDFIARAIKQTRSPRFSVERFAGDPSPVEIALGRDPDEAERAWAVKSLIDLFLRHEVPDEEAFLAHLADRAEVSLDRQALGQELHMTWGQIKLLAEAGMAIGSHGKTHRALGRLDDDAQRAELAESKRRLEEVVHGEVAAVAYPFGWSGAFNDRTLAMAAEAGYRFGFTSLEGINRLGRSDLNLLALRRLNVGTGDTPALLRARAALHGSLGKSFL